MALSTFIQAKIPNIAIDKRNLLIGYVMGWGNIPNIIDTSQGFRLYDTAHRLVVNVTTSTMTIDVSLPPKKCIYILRGMRRVVSALGGGEITVSTEYDELPKNMKEKEVIVGLKNFKEEIENSGKDLEKFISLPFDDKSFLEETDWSYELETKFVAAMEEIDMWFFAALPDLTKSTKYLINKANVENFVLFALKNGAKNIDEIVANVKKYNSEYTDHLSMLNPETCKAMKKGLINVTKIKARVSETLEKEANIA